jgi:hypothetical protein
LRGYRIGSRNSARGNSDSHSLTNADMTTMLRHLSRGAACALTATVLTAHSARAQQRFPDAWLGNWSGTLTTLSPPDSVRNQIPISLLIAKEPNGSGHVWRTVFNADTVRGVRPYRLIAEDPAKGMYATDEGNGILLDDTQIGNTLTSVFRVGPRVLHSTYSLRGDTLTHQLTWWDTTATRSVKGSGANSEGGEPVTSYRVRGMQRAVMTRVPARAP